MPRETAAISNARSGRSRSPTNVADDHSPRFVALVDEARQRIRETTPDAVADRLAANDGFVLLDVREDHEWSASRIPGAVHLARGVLERDVEDTFPDLDTPLVLYCGGGYRSALATDALRRMGYTDVASMDGGFRGWESADYPVDASPLPE